MVAVEGRVSENVSRMKRRGRPSVVSDDLARVYRNGNDFIHPRTVVNRHYEQRACSILSEFWQEPGSPFRWLADPDRMTPPGVVYRKTILCELGRIADDEQLIATASRLCELKPKTREALALIRRWRLGPPIPKPGQLKEELVRTINAYLERYPSTRWETVRKAVVEVQTALEGAVGRKRL